MVLWQDVGLGVDERILNGKRAEVSQRARISSFMILASVKVAVLPQLCCMCLALLKGFLSDAEALTMLALHKNVT